MAEILTRRDVLLSWALAEAMSPRWGGLYGDILQGGFAGTPDMLSPVEQALLLQEVQVQRKSLIGEYIDTAARFELGVLPPADIENLLLMPRMTGARRVTLAGYAKERFDPTRAEDPRNAARAILEKPTPVPYVGFPIIGWDKKLGSEVIVEGYARLIYALYRLQRGDKLGNIVAIFASA